MTIAEFPRLESLPADDRPVLLCVHASASSGRQWDALAARLRGRADVVAPDLHDHGDGPPAPRGEEDLLALDAGLVERVLRDLPGAVHLVGHSYGGAVALSAARRCPGKVRSLVVFEPAWFGLLRATAPDSDAFMGIAWIAQSVRLHVQGGRPREAARLFVDFWSGSGTYEAMSPRKRDAVVGRMGTVVRQFHGLFSDPGWSAGGRMPCSWPLLYLTGSEAPEPGGTLKGIVHTRFRHATFAHLAGCGHMGPVTHPATVNLLIETFVRRHARSDDRTRVTLRRVA